MTRPDAHDGLAPWAVRTSRGRRHPEPAPEWRSEYQRDRDRIIHAGAFRRLEYKTQVFLNHEGDLFRTRLTHSLEVNQVARTMARALGLNEDLVEAIALAHDLGHTPFGHAGQEALNRCMRDHGGFEHNLQSLRVVDSLEQRYAEFDGLNLTFETREGVLKRCARRHAERLGDVGQRFLDGTHPSLEAQLTNLADEIAYNSHDVDDGLRAGLLELDALIEVPLVGEILTHVRESHPGLDARRTIYQTVRHLISHQVDDLITTTRTRVEAAAPVDADAVRTAEAPLAAFSPEMAEAHRGLKHFLFHNLYRHYRVHRMTTKAQRVIEELFTLLHGDPQLLPPQAHESARTLEQRLGERGRARAVADYIAGMTDRFAIAEHERLHDPRRLA
ncbi:Deoxyguanosinetriphosphate triphosphohydrolase-like protein [wastewater metagenome]|uniref:Deoxyguanosinetriphosphate triphosphohydrolase-like protein n=2 Tax=unclassified sequences TaxID=12908 RepID=A0A5B8RDZ4_9ZZZZ|nr:MULTISPECIES: deoxyguanosinetriphosphate triphosphohydrolase [Arhodomonas]QEA05025.1 deoxyguanosinetriphosphate triphosphohydrolase-like protein [uncultured organism]